MLLFADTGLAGDVGVALVFAGWATGVVAVVWGVRLGWLLRNEESAFGGDRVTSRRADRLDALVMAGCLATVLSLAGPWLRGTGTDGQPLTLTGFGGLDPLSVGLIVAGDITAALLSVLTTGEPASGDRMRRTRAVNAVILAAVAAVCVGNALVQLGQVGGSRAGPAAWVTSALAVATAGIGVLRWAGDGRADG